MLAGLDSRWHIWQEQLTVTQDTHSSYIRHLKCGGVAMKALCEQKKSWLRL